MNKTAKKRKRFKLTVEKKLKLCDKAKNNVPKSVITSKLTLDDILRSEGEFKKFKAEKEELGLTIAVEKPKNRGMLHC